LFFFVVGGVEALFIRLQRTGLNHVSTPTRQTIFTMHGTTMIFLVPHDAGAVWLVNH